MPKFICDRMLKKLAVWLRISGYDTLCVDELSKKFKLDKNKEDTFFVKNYPDRILLTRDKELFSRRKAENLPVMLIKSSEVKGQIREISKIAKISPVMLRCSICNSILRTPSKQEIEEVLKREGLGRHILKKELWYCENCKKLYWKGGHWKNMLRFLEDV